MSEIRNARIRKTFLGIEDHGLLTFTLDLDYGGSGQGFGQYVLGGEFGCKAIRAVLETVGVDRWEDLPGKHVRTDAEWTRIHRLGHIIDERWLDLAELAAEKSEEAR